VAGLLCLSTGLANAYFENYPPYKFGQNPPAMIKTNLLVDYDHGDYKSNDGKVIARLVETSDIFYFILSVNGVALQENKERSTPFAYAVYEGDLDSNGLKDYIVFSSNRGCGLASQLAIVDLYLSRADGRYDRVNYEVLGGGIEDFTDLNNDGSCEVILGDMYGGKGHNYFVYSIYNIKNGKLLNANSEFKGFPKFIWYTNKKNDKDTKHLTAEERQQFIHKMDSSMTYSIVRE